MAAEDGERADAVAADLDTAGTGGVDEAGVEDPAGDDVVGSGGGGRDALATGEITVRRCVGR